MILDCNTLCGYWQRSLADTSVAQLLRLMDRAGIDAALTVASSAVWGDFRRGNAETLALCEANPRLLPVLSVRPLYYLDCVEEIRTARERGFGMIRFFPHEQGWTAGHLCFQRLVEPLAEAGLPVFYNYLDEADPMKPIPTLVDYFQGSAVPLIFGSVSYALGEFLAAGEAYPHCYTDTAQLFLHHQLEIIRDAVGLERVLFGSHAPFDNPVAPLEVVRHARLSEAEQAAVLGGNAERLLGTGTAAVVGALTMRPRAAAARCRLPLSLASPNDNRALVSAPTNDQTTNGGTGNGVAVGRPLPPQLDAPLFDVHAHYGPWPGLTNPFTSKAELLATCDRYHIETCLLSSTVAIGYDVFGGNAEVREVIAGEERLRGYVVIHPGYPEQSLAQMKEYLALPEFVGAKLHPKHSGFQADSPEARPFMEYLAAVGKPLLSHTWFREMCDAMAHLADELPELVLILGHMGGDDWEYALELGATRPNMYMELCSGLAPWGKLEAAVAAVGVERILFGSDLTLLEPGYTLGTVTGSTLSADEQRAILYGNAKRVFGG